jgi:hypothetical protein
MKLNLVSLQRIMSKRKHFADKLISAAVALEESNLGDLRKMVHKDAAGNIISEPPKLYKPMFEPMDANSTCSADPDRANPTRPRLERPLETIMSFQRNIDYTDHARRSPYVPGPGIPFPAIAKQ